MMCMSLICESPSELNLTDPLIYLPRRNEAG